MSADKVEVWAQRARIFLVLLLATAVIGATVLTVQHFQEKKNIGAFNALFKIQLLEENAAKLAEATSKSSYIEVMKNWSEAEKDNYVTKLRAVAIDYPATAASANASLKLARWYLENDKINDALPLFDNVIAQFKNGKHKVFAALAFEGKGVSLEKISKLDEAKKTFEEAVALKDNPLKPLAYMGLARTWIAQGNVAEAKTVYKKLSEEFPDSNFDIKAKALSALY